MEDLSRIIQELFQQYGNTVDKSWMVFTYGKQQHLYIQMDAKMRLAMNRVLEFCKIANQDINKFMEPVVQEMVRKSTIGLESRKQEGAINPSGDLVDDLEDDKTQW